MRLIQFGVLMALLGLAVGVEAQECGDVDGNAKVTSADALKVLRKAVGQPVALTCQNGDCIALEARLANVEAATPNVYDANGELVGRYVASGWGFGGGSSWFKVAEASSGRILEFWVEDNGSVAYFSDAYAEWMYDGGDSLIDVLYTTSNCTGTQYITTIPDYTFSQGFLRPMYIWWMPEDVRFFATVQKAPDSIAIKSKAFLGKTENCYESTRKPEGTIYQAMEVSPQFGSEIELPLTMHP